ncbi:hypothetical protein [Azospirillum brasilense]|uniref:DNA polymerase III subunit beta family protein n=1 Tax=Azospirillum brasilense TaxID=192 RepID=UPI000E68721C|nr:hypothetical protein [Azospirillum brasilense]NUB25742.1 hypothetical protein [Azospirillum brasilense]NUB33880.1 hypothetical protein [Azospirillum brasilense]RIW07746.1 hypothetical protein D2T81_02595 [Azospirillum brasilense]
MSATVPASAFRNALESVRWAAETRQSIPALTCVLIEAAGHALSLTCTDLDARATYTLTSETDAGNWRAAVPVSAVRKAVTGEGALTIAPAGAAVRFELDGRATMIPMPDDDSALDVMPLSRDFNGAALEFEACDVAQFAARTLFAISTEETRYYLNGVYLHRPNPERMPEGFRAVSTDGHRLALLDVAPRAVSGEWRETIIPRRLVSALGKVAGAKEAGPVLIEQPAAGLGLRITCGALTVVAKEIDGTFPDYARCVPGYRQGDDEIATVTMTGRDLARAVADMGSKRDPWMVAVDVAPGLPVRFYGCATAAGASADVNATGAAAGKPVQVGFNAQYMREAAKALGAGPVTIMMDGEGSPALMIAEDGYRIVQMPHRVAKVPARREAVQAVPAVVAPVVEDAAPVAQVGPEMERAAMGAQLVHHAAPVCPLDLQGYDGEANPDAEPVRYDVSFLEKVPERVLDRVRVALDDLQMVAEAMAHVRRTLGARYVAESWEATFRHRVASSLEMIERFRVLAPCNDVDAEMVLRALGGLPDVALTPAELDYFRPRVTEEEPEPVDLLRLQAFAVRHGMQPGDIGGPLTVLSSRYLARRDRMVQAVETFRASTVEELCNAQNPETYATCGTLVPADVGSGPARYESPAAPENGTFAAFMRETFGARWTIGRKRRGSDRVWITKRQYDAARQAWEARQATQLRRAPNVVVLADWANRSISNDSAIVVVREATREGPLKAG